MDTSTPARVHFETYLPIVRPANAPEADGAERLAEHDALRVRAAEHEMAAVRLVAVHLRLERQPRPAETVARRRSEAVGCTCSAIGSTAGG